MYIQKGNINDIKTPLGVCFLGLNTEETEIIKYLKVDYKKDCKYYNNLQLNALNNGLINQSIYNDIKQNEGEKIIIIEIGPAKIQKDELIKLIGNKIQVSLKSDITQIIKDLINQGYQIIKKI
jgi:hypothetical protein